MNGFEVDGARVSAIPSWEAGLAVLHGLFEDRAARTPGATAVVHGSSRLTYAELDRQADLLAERLAALGAGPEGRVAVCLDRTPAMVAALLAVLKAGSAYVPLDPAYPRERLAFTLEDSGARILLTQEAWRPLFPEGGAQILCLEDLEPIDPEEPAPPLPAPGPGHLAYVIYTSGSTGKPKGVAIEHRSVVAMIRWAQEVFSREDLAGVFASTSICFDLSVFELFLPLAAGGAVILGDNALSLAGLPAASEVTLVNTVPSAMTELLRMSALPPSARVIGMGGEPLRRALAERMYATDTVERIYNLYGPTEDTVYSTAALVPRGLQGEPTIGRPIDGTGTRIASPWFAPLSGTEEGELLLTGEGLARGYLDRPDLTAERFVPDPLAEEPGARAYRTGDLAWQQPDGEIAFLGRIDHQVKVRGFRIELGEVETALQVLPGVREAVAAAREDVPGDRRLVAYVVPAGVELSLSGLRRQLRERLPEFMVPSAFVVLPELPLTPNGKVDRKALPAPDPSLLAAEASVDFVAPRTPAEVCLAGIWEELLGLDQAGLHDHFFDLGGHSLLASRAASRVREAFGIETSVRTLFDAPTPAALAEWIEGRQADPASGGGGGGSALAPPILPSPRDGDAPLSPAQERLWLLDRFAPGSTGYNVPAAYRISGRLDASSWHRSLAEIQRRHEILRTTFHASPAGPVQRVEPPGPLPMPIADLSALPEAMRQREALRLADEDARRPFDLETGPVLRAGLLRLATDDHLALIHLHHIVTDGWSAGVMVDEIQALYLAFAGGFPSPLPELPIQYSDFAVWQREWLNGPGAAVVAEQSAYWHQRLQGDTPLELPADRPRPAAPSHRGSAVPVDASLASRRLREIARKAGATPFMAFLSAFQALLVRLTNEETLSVGTPVAGRTRRETEPLIGCFINTVVLRTSLGGNPSFLEALARVRELALEAQANQDVPFNQLVAEIQPDRSVSLSPLFQVLFVMDDAPAEKLRLPGLEFTELRPERGGSIIDLTLSMVEKDGEAARGWLEYSADLFDRTTATRLARTFSTLLEGVVANPEARLSELPLLTPVERQQVVREWTETAAPPERFLTLHGLVEESAGRTPNALAVAFGDDELTFRELDTRAARLARQLRFRGIGPERRVGLFIDRSIDLPVAVLGVLKSGGAYVALDPAYPRERVAYIAEDAGISAILTERHLEDRAPRVGVPVLLLEDLAGAGAPEGTAVLPAVPAPAEAGLENLAYLTYTSGSTGRPKGIAMPHGAAFNLIYWQAEMSLSSGVPPDAATLQFASLAFDVSFQEMFSSWLTGGSVVLIPEELRLDPDGMLRRIAERRIGRIFVPPAFLQGLAQAAESMDPLPASLVEINAAGEQLQITPQIETLLRRLPQAVLTNQYGPSETHLATHLTLPKDPADWDLLPSIGRTIRGAQTYLLDSSLQPVPVGVAGELYIGGAGVTRGYQGRPDLTADRFLPDPFGSEPGGRIYRSGDRIRFRADGRFDFLGRVDLQVKIRGFRIEPAEVEAALAAHPEIAECGVAVRRGPSGTPALAAYFVPAREPAPSARQLREFLLRSLPDYMVPSIFVMVDTMPLTPTGKVDRRALAATASSRVEETAGGEGYIAPRTAAEETLTAIWGEVLGVPRVGIHDHFFELGGHSLLAVQILSRIRAEMGIDLAVRALFEAPTPAGLAGKIEEAAGPREPTAPILPAAPAILPIARGGALPASLSQEQLWILDQVQPRIGIYNLPYALRLSGSLDVRAWLQAVAEIRRRHEALRTTFRSAGDSIFQVITPAGQPWTQTVADLSSLPGPLREPAAAELAGADARCHFDLAAGPLFRSLLLRLGPAEHIAVFGLHHSVSDGWSINVLMAELERLYPAFAAGDPSPLPELTLQQADFAVWQRRWMSGEVLAPHFEYWRRQLDGDFLLALPADRPQPAVQSFRGGTLQVALPEPFSQDLARFSRRSGGTLFMTLLAAYAALLHRYTGSEAITVGSPVANRDRPEIEGVIGLFTNLLVLRVDLGGDPTFSELMRRVRETVLGAFAHQDLPFEKLVEELRPGRQLDRIPLFPVAFTFQTLGVPALEEAGLRAVPVPVFSETSKIDLSLFLGDGPEGIEGSWEYSTDVFDRSTVARLSRHFEILLADATADPGRRLSELALLSPEEVREALEWNPGVPVPLGVPSLHARFAEQARRTPEETALTGEAGSLTYGELWERARRLAGRLCELGVGPETLVGLCAERSPDLVVGILGILAAGGAYVPLDPAYPAERLAFILDDTQAPVVVVQQSLADRLPQSRAQVVWLEDAAGQGVPLAEDAGAAAGPENAAYVIYTSGSTGNPKGVVVTHGNALRLFNATEPWFRFGAEDVWTLFHSYAFDFSVWEIWGALLYGGRLVVVPHWVSRSPEAFLDLLGRERVTVLNQTPSAFGLLAQGALRKGAPATDLRWVIFGGEALSARSLAPWLERFGDRRPRLVNMYGITETTVHVTWRLIDKADASGASALFGSPIGAPIPDLSVHVLDVHRRALPVGVPGEMYVGGAGLARGYLGQPALTAGRFVPDPFAAAPGGRLYRTGDLARRQPSGELEFLGRADAQVKIRGFRIEPGEIEAALGSHPSIDECAVVARRGPMGEPSLAAYLVPRQAPAPPARDLREHLLGKIPEHMVPSAFLEVESLPRTPSGKVDRRALALLEPDRPGRGPGSPGLLSQQTPVEELLAGIFAEVLNLDRVSGEDDFFDLGGHSLLATQVINRVRAAFTIDLPLRTLFEVTTPAGLARRVEQALRGQAGAPTAPPIVPAAGDRLGQDLPLSFAQERLWILDQMQPGDVYNVPFGLRLTGALDPAVWQSTLTEIRRRHEPLRTTFPVDSRTPGRPVQSIAPPSPWPAGAVDLSGLPAQGQEAEARRLVREEARRPFDLAAGPLARAALLRLNEGEHLAVLAFHHIVSDGWSMGVFLTEVEALYTAFAAGRRSPLPELPVQYADYAVWQRDWLQGEVLDRQLAYWRRQLAGDPVLALPTDRPAPPVQTFRGASLDAPLAREIPAALAALGGRSGTTLFMVVTAAFAALLHRWSGSEDFAIGTPIANRNRPEIERLIGFFANTLAIRTDLSGDPTFAEMLGRVRETALSAYSHQDVPFEKLVEELRPERRLDQNPFFQVALNLDQPLHPSEDPEHAGPLGISYFWPESWSAKFDLTLGLTEIPGGLATGWEYKTDLFDAATVARLARTFETLLTGAVARPDRRLSALSLLSPAEAQQVQVEWNDTATPFPRAANLAGLFAAQAALSPQAVALAQGGETVTYRALAERANRIAGRLRSLGVGPETRVAIALPRSFDLIAAILGVVAAGGAYVPLDPSYPDERLAWMLADSGAEVLVTRRETTISASGLARVDLETVGDGDLPALPALPAPPVPPCADLAAANLAYVMYTSGSTGIPKGVAVTHRNVARLVLETDYARFGPDEVFLGFAPASFDASTLEIWGPLLHGGRLVLAPEGRLSLAELAAVIRDGGVTTMWLTAGLFHQMVDEEIESLGGVEQLLAGGDVVSPSHARALLERHPGLVLINGYGPTEGTTFSCCHPMTEPSAVLSPVPIGRPIANARALVLDAHLQRVAAGMPGELYLGGDGLARGYLGRPDLTAERFLPDPFGAEGLEPGARLYRTGDRVRFRADGQLEFLGRTDLQVKVAGHRIEPGEIEAVLSRHPAVRESAVLAMDDAQSGRRLVAYVAGTKTAAAELRTWLRERLPESLVPALFVFLDRLPLTPNGKVDRRALPEPSAASDAEAADAARTPAEELLTGLWAEALGLDSVGIHDSFFELGGHSLLATRVMARLRQVFRVDLSLRALFEEPTVAGMAALLARQTAEENGSPLPDIEALPPAGAYPLSLAQRRLWILQQLAPGDPFLNVAHALRFAGPLQPGTLRRSLEEIVARHEPLRTTFGRPVEAGGEPFQRISSAGHLDLPLIDLAALPDGWREPEAQRIAADESRRPFDLERGPLLRAALLRLAAADHLLLLDPHHLVFDGWSMGVFFRELETLYAAFADGRPSPLPPLPVRYVDFAAWQRRAFSDTVLEHQLSYWKGKLDGLPALELPTDRPRPAIQRFTGAWSETVLPAPAVEALSELCRRQGVTFFMALLALFEVLLARISGQEDFPVGTPIANRSRPEVEGLIGFFVNTLVLRADLSGNPDLRELLERVRATSLDAYAHQDLPFESLVEALQPERQLGGNPLFNVLFSLQDVPVPVELPGLSAQPYETEVDTAHFDLMMFVARDGSGAASAALNVRLDLFEPATAQRLAGQFRRLVEAAAADPGQRVLDLPLWSPAAWHQVAREWNDTRGALPGARTIHELVEAQAARTPNALAVSGPESRLTYRELNERADQLAASLRRLGAGPEVRIAACFERSPEIVLACLAVLKAGGAYLPLDPTHPAERLTLVVADACAPIVLTRKRWASRFSGSTAQILILDEISWAPESAGEPERPACPVGRDNAACVIYTSGSTGTPKGAEITHGSVLNLIALHQRRFALTPDDGGSLVANPAFDAAIFEIWPILALGASLHAPPFEIVASPRELLRWMAREKVTHAFLPTPVAEGALSQDPPPGFALRFVLAGGDRLRRAPVAGSPYELINVYGPTECTVLSTWLTVPHHPAGLPERLPSIGRPIANAEVWLLDRDRREVPFGSVGEIYLGGAGLARGYLRRPDLTAERFVPHPFAEELGRPGARLYRTGDLARHLPNGEIEFVGRTDHQVKIRGFRIEPGEIEARLGRHPGLQEALVVTRRDGAGNARLVAYVVPRRPGEASAPATAPPADIAELREFLRVTLPEYMVPSAFITLDEMPLTSRGKVDRRALPDVPEAPSSLPEDRGAAPRGETEQRITRIWGEVLGSDAFGRDDNFFDLGGHSLALVAAHERLQAELGRDLPLVELFENSTVRSLALALDKRLSQEPPAGQEAAQQNLQERAEKQRSAQGWKERARQARRIPRS